MDEDGDNTHSMGFVGMGKERRILERGHKVYSVNADGDENTRTRTNKWTWTGTGTLQAAWKDRHGRLEVEGRTGGIGG